MASDIHKKLVLGALGCGGLFVVVGVLGLLLSRNQVFKSSIAEQTYTPEQAVEAWDSLIHFPVADSVYDRKLPPWSFGAPPGKGTLRIDPSRRGGGFTGYGDTFPAGSEERVQWEKSSTQVSLLPPGAPDVSPYVPSLPSAGMRLFQARALFAAARKWAREGRASDGRLAMDSALGLARDMQKSGALERLQVGLRIERDAMALLSRDAALAGGAPAAERAGRRVAPLDRDVARVRDLDRLLNVAGSSAVMVGDLGDWVADSTMPLAVRTAAVRAIGLAWTFNPTESTTGKDPERTRTLEKLRKTALPDSVVAAIDRVIHEGDTFPARLGVAATYRLERQLLDWP